MKRIAFFYVFVLVLFVLQGCSTQGPTGQLVGVDDRPQWEHINPYGMSYIPSGTLHTGGSDQDFNASKFQRPRSRSIQGFYMDDTEITNNEYRQFINYVRDSTAHAMLDHYEEDDLGNRKIDWTYDIDWAEDSKMSVV